MKDSLFNFYAWLTDDYQDEYDISCYRKKKLIELFPKEPSVILMWSDVCD